MYSPPRMWEEERDQNRWVVRVTKSVDTCEPKRININGGKWCNHGFYRDHGKVSVLTHTHQIWMKLLHCDLTNLVGSSSKYFDQNKQASKTFSTKFLGTSQTEKGLNASEYDFCG